MMRYLIQAILILLLAGSVGAANIVEDQGESVWGVRLSDHTYLPSYHDPFAPKYDYYSIDTSRWYIDTVVCVEGCPEGYGLCDGSCIKFYGGKDGFDSVDYKDPTKSCDTLWLPKKQVWLTENEYIRLMYLLHGDTSELGVAGPILTPEMTADIIKRKMWPDSTRWNDVVKICPTGGDMRYLDSLFSAYADSIRNAAKQGMFDAWNTHIDSVPKDASP